MAGGKFSKPRPHRDEERQIEQTFRQVTGQAPMPEQPVIPKPAAPEMPKQSPVSQNTIVIEQAQMDETFRQVTGRQRPRPQPPVQPAFELHSDEMDISLEMPEPEEPDSQPDFIDKIMNFVNQFSAPGSKKQTAVLLGICAVSLLVIVVCISLFFAGSVDPNDGNILDNVYLADIPVGGMTKSEAISALKEATSHTYGSQDMVIDLSGHEIRLTPRDTGVKLDVKAAVNAAYDYGRTGTQAEREQALSGQQPYYIGLLPYLELKEDYILDTLRAYNEDSGSTLTQPTYGLEGREPELSADKFNKEIPAQTLVIHLGTPGVGFDVQDVYTQVLDAYSLHTFLVTVENVQSVKEPDDVDLQKIYDEYYVAPVDASVNMQNFETIPGRYGYGFDLEEAQKLLDKAQYGDELRIPMEFLSPDVLDSNSFYKDVLGNHQTRHTSNENRNINLRLACEAINGTVLDPGETFSFNSTVGQRTGDRGYRTAPADSSTTGGSTLGGGISQVSSTLYYAVLLSDLEVLARQPNQFAPGFIDYGLDANVSWGLYDFSFRNNLGYPIRIQAEVSGGYVRISILGTEERNHYVLMDYTITKTKDFKTEKKDFPFNNEEEYKNGDVVREGITGYTIKTYKLRYDLQTSELLSRDYVATTEYESVNRIVANVLPEETVPPTTVPPTTTAPPTTEPPTSAPTTAPTDPPASDPTDPPTEAPAPTETQPETPPPAAEPGAENPPVDAA